MDSPTSATDQARLRRRMTVAAAAFAAALLGAACSGSSGTPSSAPADSSLRAPRAAATGAPAGQRVAAIPAVGGATTESLRLPQLRARIVKTAALALRLREGSFTERFQEASLVAARHGGFVASSQTEAGKLRSGTLTLRVPADQFEVTLSELRALGTLRSERLSGQDVTAQFVDLQARLRNWEAQEAVLLRLFDRATSVEDSIRIERQVQDVQLNIEEIRGQLHVLSDQTDMSTVTLSLAEARGTPRAHTDSSAFSRAWHQAGHGVVVVAAGTLVALGYAFPFLLIGVVAIGLWLLVRRRSPWVSATR